MAPSIDVEKTSLKLKVVGVFAGLLVIGGGVWNVAVYYAGVNTMRESLGEVKAGQAKILEFLNEKVITREEYALYMRTAEAINDGWKAPPVK